MFSHYWLQTSLNIAEEELRRAWVKGGGLKQILASSLRAFPQKLRGMGWEEQLTSCVSALLPVRR